MKKSFIIATLLTLTTASTVLSAPPPQVQAQIEEREELREQKMEELQELKEEKEQEREARKEELKEKIEEKRATREAQLTQRRMERIRELWGRLRIRLLAHINRLQRLVDRMESRLAKIEENGEDIDTSDIQAELAAAKDLLGNAEADLAAADDTLEDVLSSEDPKTAFEVVRETISEIKMTLVQVHTNLVHLIGDMRGLRVGQGGEGGTATPSATATPTSSLPTATPTPELTPTAAPTATPTPTPTT